LCKELPSIRDKISVIPSGSIDGFEYYHKTFDKSNFIVLQNGVRPHKNLETTIQALQGISCKLLVVRKMDESQIQLANRLNIKFENVYDLSPEEVKETYRRSDIVCFPSSYEGFGVITIEAQAIGRPVITTNKEPMKSVAGDAALYINNPKDPAQLHDAIIKLINDDKLRENLIKKGLENSRQYRLGSIASKYIDIFSSIEK
jgi:glycosyltransferase involved in cell wall biosynthesis